MPKRSKTKFTHKKRSKKTQAPQREEPDPAVQDPQEAGSSTSRNSPPGEPAFLQQVVTVDVHPARSTTDKKRTSDPEAPPQDGASEEPDLLQDVDAGSSGSSPSMPVFLQQVVTVDVHRPGTSTARSTPEAVEFMPEIDSIGTEHQVQRPRVHRQPEEIVRAAVEEEDVVGVQEINEDGHEFVNALVEDRLLRGRQNQLITYLRAADRQVEAHSLGPMNGECVHCHAKFFLAERTTRRQFTKCCKNGQIALKEIRNVALDEQSILGRLFADRHPLSRHFKENILKYNYAFQFASIETNLREFANRRGPYVYAIQGQIFNNISDVNLNEERVRYAQLYFLSPEEAVERRVQNLSYAEDFGLERGLIEEIEDFLRTVNPYAGAYRHLREQYDEQNRRDGEMPNLVLELLNVRGRDRRPYDLPQVREVAAVYRLNENDPRDTFNLRIFLRDRPANFHRISYLNQHADPLTFPLLFPMGQVGWDVSMRTGNNLNLTLLDFYTYKMQTRANEQGVSFQRAGKLFQQYVVSAYIKVEASRLCYILNNQNKMRAEEYVGLADYLHNRVQIDVPIGRMIILPSTYVGSPRSQQQRFQDSMAVVAKYGNPSLFITMTANPKWTDIVNNIPHGDEPGNHPMLIATVFQVKLKALIDEILNNHVFGVPVAQLHVIEFQKRGLPHAHILTILRQTDKLLDSYRIDQLISAEIPDEATEPRLYELVARHMVHGPCGTLNQNCVCMINGECSKKFPKALSNETTISERGGIIYKRRFTERRIVKGTHSLDNRWIVPYNAYCLLKYECHINVEACANVGSVKYLYKYFFKGPDSALVQVAGGDQDALQYNEVENYLSARYMTPPEAAWHFKRYPIHENTHTVVRLPVHLPQQQLVRFREGDEEEALERNERTMLTEWFALNVREENSRQYLYSEIPLHYVWCKVDGIYRWKSRVRGGEKIIARMFSVSLRHRELYFLRLLLLHVRGARSFEEVRTVNGIVHGTFMEACRARNLLQDDAEWKRCLREAVLKEMPMKMRQLFSFILCFCEVVDVPALYDEFKEHLFEDFTRRGATVHEAENRCLQDVQRILFANGTRLSNFNLPEPVAVIAEEIDVDVEAIEGEGLRISLNDDQRAAFDRIIHAVRNEREDDRLFYLCGAGGTGKTYVYNTLISVLRGEQIPVLSMAWTGLAASILKGGRTVHSLMKLPVPILETSTSFHKANTTERRNIASAKLIIWDEISMATKTSFEIVDKTLRFLCNNDPRPFAGKVLVLGGDFKQCLPIVPNGTRNAIAEACVKNSDLWRLFEELHLSVNVRANADEEEFSRWLLQLGNNNLPTLDVEQLTNIIEIPQRCLVSTKEQLLDFCFGQMTSALSFNKVVLTPLNETCHEVNRQVLDRLEGEIKTYYSADSVDEDDVSEFANYPVEFLNTLCPTGLPLHKLDVKNGAVVILLKNLNVKKGLCNGTRMMIKNAGEHLIEVRLLDRSGRVTDEIVLIPRVDFAPSDTTLPFKMKRRQFPIRLAYAMTVNKAQGQTFDSVGVYLPNTVFSHGQLYVCFSRVRSFDDVKVYVEDTAQQGRLLRNSAAVYTKNVVYPEVL